MYQLRKIYPVHELPDQERIDEIVCGIRAMQEPRVLRATGSNYPDNEQTRYAFGMINKESNSILVLEGSALIVDTNQIHVQERPIMRYADELLENVKITFPEKPRWCEVYIGEPEELYVRRSKMKIMELEKILKGAINANKREGKMPD